MGSLVPFQDLNLLPDPPMASATSTCLTPKIEPKLEPFDQSLHTQLPLQPPPGLPAPNPKFHPNSLTPPFSEPTHTPLSQTSTVSSEEDNVYSEFCRVSELFNTAFSNRMEQLGDGDANAVTAVLDSESGAIVPVPSEEENRAVALSRTKRYPPRSGELVRVTDLGLEDQRYFRDVVRRTRMVFDSMRVYSIAEEERRSGPGHGRRAYWRASSVMKDRGLWLNRDKRIVGAIPGVYIGDLFLFRMELCVVGLHGHSQAGIDYVPISQSSNGEPIATSIIVSGGYEDDEDAGDVIIYTGHGGQDKLNRQTAHQKLEGGNLAMERSMHYGIEVRVIRGIKYHGSMTSKVYVYDGLYKVIDCWFDVGKSGFGVYKFKLTRIDEQPEMGSTIYRFAQTLRTRPLDVRPNGYLSFDISMKKEKYPVFLFNDIDADHDPLYYEYLERSVFPAFVVPPGASGTGCDCVSGCGESCLCAMKNGGEFAYDYNGTLVRGKPVVFECGKFCQCPPTCRNRVTQHGLKNRLEVFRSRETGWGVRSLELISAGSFICEYAGVVLTREQAQVFAMNGDTLIYPSRFSERWAEWGDLSQIYSDYVRPTHPSIPPLDFAMDVSRMRNVACYISHSATPNVLVQFVLHDHNNLSFPRVMLFALENIPALRELSLDYGVPGVADDWTGKLSICN